MSRKSKVNLKSLLEKLARVSALEFIKLTDRLSVKNKMWLWLTATDPWLKGRMDNLLWSRSNLPKTL